MTVDLFVVSAISAGVDRVKSVVGPATITTPMHVDVDATETRRRKVQEWVISNVHHIKTVPSSKERAVRLLMSKGINEGWSKPKIIEQLKTQFGVSPGNAKRMVITEVRRAYQWAFRKTAYMNGYRNVKFRIHPGACKKCIPLNGRIFPITDDPIPVHPNCRCWLELVNIGYISPVPKKLVSVPKFDIFDKTLQRNMEQLIRDIIQNFELIPPPQEKI